MTLPQTSYLWGIKRRALRSSLVTVLTNMFAAKGSRPTGALPTAAAAAASTSPSKLSINGSGNVERPLKRNIATPQNGGKKSASLLGGAAAASSGDSRTARVFHGDDAGGDGHAQAGATARSSTGHSGQGQGQGKGKGRGRERNSGFKEKVKLGGATLAEQVKNLTAALLMTMRLVCAHAREFRRIAKEGNVCLLLERRSHAPGRLDEAQTKWKEEIPEKDELNPFPTNTDGPWRFRAFATLIGLVKSYTEQPQSAKEMGEEERKKVNAAVETLSSDVNMRRGLQRFWRLKSLNTMEGAPDDSSGDKDKEIWLMRFAPNPHGHKCEQALAFLDSLDIVDQALMGAEIRQDRAPKGGLQRALEGVLEAALGKKGSNNVEMKA